jgi:hypothetical protein
MILVLFLTAILSAANVQPAVELWAWFASHVLLTILMVLVLA